MSRPVINVSVSGIAQPENTYKTAVLKNNIPFADQVNDTYTRYVVKWDFDLGGQTVTIPANCILQFDGGILKNGTVELNDTNVWPCFDALTIGGVEATGTHVCSAELFYKEYKKLYHDAGLSSFDYYVVPIEDLLLANSLYGHVTLKYGYNRYKVLVGNTDDVASATEYQELVPTVGNTIGIPWTLSSSEIEVLEEEERNYIFLCKTNTRGNNYCGRNLRITY